MADTCNRFVFPNAGLYRQRGILRGAGQCRLGSDSAFINPKRARPSRDYKSVVTDPNDPVAARLLRKANYRKGRIMDKATRRVLSATAGAWLGFLCFLVSMSFSACGGGGGDKAETTTYPGTDNSYTDARECAVQVGGSVVVCMDGATCEVTEVLYQPDVQPKSVQGKLDGVMVDMPWCSETTSQDQTEAAEEEENVSEEEPEGEVIELVWE